MYRTLVLCLLFSTVISVAVAEERPSEPSNPPRILVASSIDEHGNLELVSYRTIYIGFDGSSYNHRSTKRISLKDVLIQDLDQNPLSMDEARERFKGGDVPVLVMTYRQSLSAFFRPLFSGDAMVFVFPREAPEWQTIQDPGRPVRE